MSLTAAPIKLKRGRKRKRRRIWKLCQEIVRGERGEEETDAGGSVIALRGEKRGMLPMSSLSR